MLHEAKFAHAIVVGSFWAGTETKFCIGPYGKEPRVAKTTTAREVSEFIARHSDFVYELYADDAGKLHVNAFDKTEELMKEVWR